MSQAQTQPVALKSRPDLDLHVKSISALEDCALRDKMAAFDVTKQGDEPRIMATMLSAYVVNPDGSPAFATPDDALTFMGTAKRNVCWKLIREGQKLNALTDEAIEDEEKN